MQKKNKHGTFDRQCIDAHRGEMVGVRSEKLSHYNAIKLLQKGNSLDFLTTPSTLSKEFAQNPKDYPFDLKLQTKPLNVITDNVIIRLV
jgi:hypothetical protein